MTNAYQANKSQQGSTLAEVSISIVVLSVGLLAMLSALTYALLYAQEAEKKTQAKEIAASIVENVFAIRDIKSKGDLALDGWEAVQVKRNGNEGIFIDGWFPVREQPGADGVYGTADDSCTNAQGCATAPTIVSGYERNIAISDLVENGVVRKRRVDVNVRYKGTGQSLRQETISTIIANLPRKDN